MRSRWVKWAVATALLVVFTVGLAAQRGGGGFFGFGRGRSRCSMANNIPYDGQFNVVRIVYRGYGSWDADCPVMERNLATMLSELTSIVPHREANNILLLDDPELLKYPVAYLTEPGYWHPNEEEVQGLRTYLAKGGFLIVDDFYDPNDHFGVEWQVFYDAIMRVLPTAKLERLDVTHPVFNTFFSIKTLAIPYPGRYGQMGLMGEFFGIHEDNDPEKPLKVIINYNIDVGDYLEWSGDDRYEFMATNEAYKLMINYVAYGLTH
jgi:hypothetical protein